ncbi:MAG: hypothetical protein JWR19_1975 [Pedosphaera sp.]|nr:hypothetical protein [Pedosphaera sp.]
MKKFHGLILTLGFVLLVFLIRKIGIRELSHELRLLGWGLVPIVFSEGVAEFLHVVGWRYCFSGPLRSVPLLRLFSINMAGFAISYLTPMASLGGDVTKASLLTLNHKGPEAVAGVLAGKLSFALAHLLIVVIGAIVILGRIPLPRALWDALLASSTLLGGGIVAFLLLQKHGKLGALVRWLVRRNVGGKPLRRLAVEINQVDEALQVFYRERPWGLLLAVFWHLLGYSVGLFQSWYFLQLMADNPSLRMAAGVWILGLWFDLLSFAVPLNLGVLEATRIVAFRAIGYGALLGMTYGMVYRVAQLFWVGFGLANYVLLISRRKSHRRLPDESELRDVS